MASHSLSRSSPAGRMGILTWHGWCSSGSPAVRGTSASAAARIRTASGCRRSSKRSGGTPAWLTHPTGPSPSSSTRKRSAEPVAGGTRSTFSRRVRHTSRRSTETAAATASGSRRLRSSEIASTHKQHPPLAEADVLARPSLLLRQSPRTATMHVALRFEGDVFLRRNNRKDRREWIIKISMNMRESNLKRTKACPIFISI